MTGTAGGRGDSRRRAGGDAAVIALGYLTSFAYPLVSLPFLVRTLGVAQLGTVMLVLAVLQVVVHVTDFGFGISALRRASLAGDTRRRSRVLTETVLAKSLIWAICAAVLLAAVLAVPGLREYAPATALGLVLVLAGAWYPGWMLQALGRMITFAAVMALSRLVALAGLLLTVRDPDDGILAVGWQLAPQALAAGATWVLLTRVWKVAGALRVSRAGVVTALRDSAPLFVANAAVIATGSASTLSLGALSTAPQVAFFGAAERFGNAVRGVMRGVSDAMMPRLVAGANPAMRRFVHVGVAGAFLLSGAALVLGAGWVIPWYLGEDMTEAITTTRLMGIAIAVAGISATLSLRATAAHRYGAVARLTGIAGVSHALLCIPGALFGGADGVALALIVSESLLAILFLVDARRGARGRGTPGHPHHASDAGTAPGVPGNTSPHPGAAPGPAVDPSPEVLP